MNVKQNKRFSQIFSKALCRKKRVTNAMSKPEKQNHIHSNIILIGRSAASKHHFFHKTTIRKFQKTAPCISF